MSMGRIYNAQGMVVIDYDKIEAQIEAHLSLARSVGCLCVTVNEHKNQLLYLGNRPADAIRAKQNRLCEVYYTAQGKPKIKKSKRKKS